MKRLALSLLMLLLGLWFAVKSHAAPATGPLRVLAQNPRYFTDGSGKAIYLTGSHTWHNFKDYGTGDPPPAFNYTAYLAFLKANNHNWFRLWSWELPYSTLGVRNELWRRTPFPWPRTGPGTATDGKPKFDLSRLDQPYFDRLRAHVVEACNQGLYASVMMWDGYGLSYNRNSADGFPYQGDNNINGINCGGPDSQTLNCPSVTAAQETYLRKVIDTVNDLDCVMYEIANESGPYSTNWQYHMITAIKQYEAQKTKQHPVGMTFQPSGGTDATLYNSPADWVSPQERFPQATGNKVIINDTDHSYYWVYLKQDGVATHQPWVWKNFTAGNNTAFMDPYLVVWPDRNAPTGSTPDPYWNPMRLALGRTRSYAERMNLAAMTPQPSKSSTGHCLASVGTEYLVYQPTGGQSFTATLAAGSYQFEWFDPTNGTVAATGTFTAAAGPKTFGAPFSGDSVLYLKSASAPDTTAPAAPRNVRVL